MQAHASRHPVVLTAAITGPTYPAARYPNIPLGLDHIADDVEQVHAAGARAIHYHARDPSTGEQFADATHYRRVRALLHALLPNVPVSFASSRKGHVEKQIAEALDTMGPFRDATAMRCACVVAELVRAVAVEVQPERVTTFTPPELLIAGETGRDAYEAAIRAYSPLTQSTWKDAKTMRAYYRALTARARALGVQEELEITTWRAFDVIEQIAMDPALGLPPHVSVVVLFGYSKALPIGHDMYEAALARIAGISRATNWVPHITVGAAIQPAHAIGTDRQPGEVLTPGKHDYREVIEWVAFDPRVDSFRVGLEDTPELFGRMPTNADLVAHARREFERLGVEIELDVAEVRRRFGLEPEALRRAA